MAKALNIKNWMVAGAAAVAAYLCIHKKKTISGIGWVRPTFGKKRIDSYFSSERLIPDEVELDLTYKKGEYVDGTFRYNWKPSVYFWISREDAKYLSELCDKYDVDFNAWNGDVWLPTMHKKIAYSAEELMNL